MGEKVVRGGLEALGARLEDGKADDWPVDQAAANAVSPALADALGAHISIAGEVLMSGADGNLPSSDGALLRGLSYVTLDRTAAGAIEAALSQWVSVQPVPVGHRGPPPMLPAVVVPNAYLAVQEYGQRLAYTLHEIELAQEAQDRAFLWNMTIGLAADLAPGPWGMAAGVLVGYVAMGLQLDGTWDSPGYHGLRFAPGVPAPDMMTDLTPEEWTMVDRTARHGTGLLRGCSGGTGDVAAPRVCPDPLVGPSRGRHGARPNGRRRRNDEASGPPAELSSGSSEDPSVHPFGDKSSKSNYGE